MRMRLPGELKAACGVNAAAMGAAFVSGREAAVFFAAAGWASWIGIFAASAVFALLMGMICRFAIDTGARDLPGIFARKMDERCGDSVGAVYVILMLMMGAAALSTAGELGMLSLNGKHPYIIGAGLAVAVAAVVAIRGMKPLGIMGMIVTPVVVVFFCALAIDPRPAGAGAYLSADVMGIKGNVPAAVLMGALFASLKAALACGVAAGNAKGMRPAVFGVLCGGIMAVCAGTVNWALVRAGESVWTLNLPAVVLAARWGVFGYYVCIFVMWCGAAAVLACAMSSIMSLFSLRVKRSTALIMTGIGVIMMSATGLRSLVGVGFPMVGWICAMCLCALAFFYERRDRKSISGLKSVG